MTALLCFVLCCTAGDNRGVPDRYSPSDKLLLEGVANIIAAPLKAVHTEVKRAGDNFERATKAAERAADATANAFTITPYALGAVGGVLLCLMVSRQPIQVKKE